MNGNNQMKRPVGFSFASKIELTCRRSARYFLNLRRFFNFFNDRRAPCLNVTFTEFFAGLFCNEKLESVEEQCHVRRALQLMHQLFMGDECSHQENSQFVVTSFGEKNKTKIRHIDSKNLPQSFSSCRSR